MSVNRCWCLNIATIACFSQNTKLSREVSLKKKKINHIIFFLIKNENVSDLNTIQGIKALWLLWSIYPYCVNRGLNLLQFCFLKKTDIATISHNNFPGRKSRNLLADINGAENNTQQPLNVWQFEGLVSVC